MLIIILVGILYGIARVVRPSWFTASQTQSPVNDEVPIEFISADMRARIDILIRRAQQSGKWTALLVYLEKHFKGDALRYARKAMSKAETKYHTAFQSHVEAEMELSVDTVEAESEVVENDSFQTLPAQPVGNKEVLLGRIQEDVSPEPTNVVSLVAADVRARIAIVVRRAQQTGKWPEALVYVKEQYSGPSLRYAHQQLAQAEMQYYADLHAAFRARAEKKASKAPATRKSAGAKKVVNGDLNNVDETDGSHEPYDESSE